jgi:hypothetical protein
MKLEPLTTREEGYLKMEPNSTTRPVIVNSPVEKQPFIPCANIQTALYYLNQIESGEELNWYYDTENWKASKWFVVIPDSNVN